MTNRKVSNLTKKKVAASQEWKCNKCNNLFDECYEIDHIICLKDGGNNEISNLQALCPNCHRKKTNNDMSKKDEKSKKEKILKDEKPTFITYNSLNHIEKCKYNFTKKTIAESQKWKYNK